MRSGSTSLAYSRTAARIGWYCEPSSTSNPAALSAAIVVNMRKSGSIVTFVACAAAETASKHTRTTARENRPSMACNHNIKVLMAAPCTIPAMEFGISTQIYRGQPVTVDLLESMRKAGYNRFELFCNRPHLDFHNRSLLRAIGRWFQENALPPPSLHLPFMENVGPKQRIWISVLEPERRYREAALDEIKQSLEFSDHVGLAYVVMHLGNPKEKFSPVAFEYAYAAISQIRAFSGVEVVIENIPNEISTLERIEEFKNVSQVPDIGICYDTGHGHLQGVDHSFEHIRTTHNHDNNAQPDEHPWPLEGT